MNIKWPGPLLFMYDSSLGKTISPVSIALYIEVINKKPIISRVSGYKCRALLEYDEGSYQNIIQDKNSSLKFEYKTTGKAVEKWRTLHSIGFIGDQVYYVINDDWSKAKRIDFTQNGFDTIGPNKQLQPGESVMGWMFFELEQDLRGQLLKIKEIEFILTNSVGESQTFKSYQKLREEEEMTYSLTSGTWNVMGGYYDLTKEQYSMVPTIDLRQILKDGKAQFVKPSTLGIVTGLVGL